MEVPGRAQVKRKTRAGIKKENRYWESGCKGKQECIFEPSTENRLKSPGTCVKIE